MQLNFEERRIKSDYQIHRQHRVFKNCSSIRKVVSSRSEAITIRAAFERRFPEYDFFIVRNIQTEIRPVGQIDKINQLKHIDQSTEQLFKQR
jgi:hypothetical protein